MAEQEIQNKPPAKYKRILKWIGVGCLALILIAAVYFRAPWKVIALLLIFLSACTVLPKPARKWFLAGIGLVVLGLIIWVFLPEDNEGWRPYTFDDEFATLEAKYAVPDEQNAATIYNELLNKYDQQSPDPNLMVDDFYYTSMYEHWNSDDHPEIAQWLTKQQETIATLLQASELEKCRFTIWSDPVSLQDSTRILAAMREWVNLLILSGNNDLGEGRLFAGLRKYIAASHMGTQLRQQPALIDKLVAISFEGTAARQLRIFVVDGDATEEYLRTIEEVLGANKYDWTSDMMSVLEHEKLYAKNEWCTAYEIDTKGRIRLSRDPAAQQRALRDKQLESWDLPKDARDALKFRFWQRKLMKANTIVSWFYMPSNPERVAGAVDMGFEKLYALAQPSFEWSRKPGELSIRSRFSIPVRLSYLVWFKKWYATKFVKGISRWDYYKFHELYQRRVTDKRGTQLVIGLQRYKNRNGNWPETLEDIRSLAPADVFVDPSNGGSFVYKLRQDTFILYSRGINNIDETGQRWSDDDGSGPDDWLIWPSERRLHEMNEEHAQEPPT